MDIGAVYNYPPMKKSSIDSKSFTPQERELVFDIDITDYDAVRVCGCKEAKICRFCWPLMNIAARIVQDKLEREFGFKHILWIFSGRRGLHCWVCDKSARALSTAERGALVDSIIASYLHFDNLPPSFREIFNRFEQQFDAIYVQSQNIFQSNDGIDALCKVVFEFMEKRHKDVAFVKKSVDELRKVLAAGQVSSFAELKPLIRNECANFVLFRFLYPRIDAAVSRGVNHLLKAPFCVHPSTQQVCVPILPEKLDSFQPFDVPSLPDIVRYLEQGGNPMTDPHAPLSRHVQYFRAFVARFAPELF